MANEKFHSSEIWRVVTDQGPQLLHLFDMGTLDWDEVTKQYRPQASCGTFHRGVNFEHKHNVSSGLDYKCPVCMEYAE